MEKKNDNSMVWMMAALGVGLLVSVGVYALLAYSDEKVKDPRTKNVEKLIQEAEHLLELERRGEYHARRNRG